MSTSDCPICRNGSFPQIYHEKSTGKHCPACDREISLAMGRRRDLRIDVDRVESVSKKERALYWILGAAFFGLIVLSLYLGAGQ